MKELLIIAFVIWYFIPTIIAYARGNKKASTISKFNSFLGWTVIGWFVALTWATQSGSGLIRKS